MLLSLLHEMIRALHCSYPDFNRFCAYTSLEHLAGGTVSFSDGGSGVQGREMFLIDGPVLECARRNVADLGRGVDGGFCSNEEEKVSE